jgi:hypothetical protein
MPRRQRSEYIDPPALIARRSEAVARGWMAGWPDRCPSGDQVIRVDVVRYPADGRVFSVRVDRRLGPLIAAFLGAAQRVGYPLVGADEVNVAGDKQGGVGSLNCRAIKGSNPAAPSNHSTGTALDLWSRSNPLLRNAAGVPFRSTIHPAVVELAAAADLYWGGWYWDASKTRVDAMHFEYMRRPADVSDSLRKLDARYKELAKPTVDTGGTDVTPEQVKALQTALNKALGTTLVVDGKYGPATTTALAALAGHVETLRRERHLALELLAKAQTFARSIFEL